MQYLGAEQTVGSLFQYPLRSVQQFTSFQASPHWIELSSLSLVTLRRSQEQMRCICRKEYLKFMNFFRHVSRLGLSDSSAKPLNSIKRLRQVRSLCTHAPPRLGDALPILGLMIVAADASRSHACEICNYCCSVQWQVSCVGKIPGKDFKYETLRAASDANGLAPVTGVC